MSNKIERRFITAELRSVGDDAATIRGLAACHYDGTKRTQSQNLGGPGRGFVERLMPGCFDRCLSQNPDVRILFNHDPNLVLGRTSAGTAKVWADATGLQFSCQLPNTRTGQELRESIKRGDISQCSFGFIPGEDDWDGYDQDEAGERCQVRSIKHVAELLDCSPVTYPAYTATTVSARALWPDGEPAAVLRAMQQHNREAELSFARTQRRNLINRVIGQ